MGTIPVIATNPGAVPATSGAPRASQEAFNAVSYETIKAGNRLADFGSAFAEKYIDAKMQVEAADQTAGMSQKLQEISTEASKIPDRAQATAAYDAQSQKLFDEYQKQGGNPLVVSHVTTRFQQERVLRRNDTQHAAFALESQTQRGKLITQLDQWGKDAATSADPRLRDKLIEDGVQAIDGRVAGGWMNPEAGAKAKVDFQSSVYRALIDKAFATDPRYGIAMATQYGGKLNAQDSHVVGVRTENEKVELNAETMVNNRLPVLGTYGNASNWGSIIEGAAVTTGLRASLIGAVASGESAGKAGAVSTAGARGPMQLMPGTAGDLGVKDSHNPNEAIPKGAGYLKQMIDRYQGDEVAGLAAYNWGPGNVDKWKKEGGDFSKLPKETQAYIRDVQAKDKNFAANAKSGDALANYRTEALKAEQEILADPNMDPRLRSRALTLLQQRSRTTEGLVLSQRKAADDEGETAALGLFNGKYVDGTFANIAEKFRQTGDNSKASVYDFMAANEGALKDFGSLPPGAQRSLAHMLPGAAGKIAQSILAEGRVDRKEMREEAARQHSLFTKGVQEGLAPEALAQNAREAAMGYAAAGDYGKAKEVVAAYEGVVEGTRKGGMPTSQAEAELRRLKEIAESSNGLDAKTSAVIGSLEKGIQKNREAWKNDPMTAAEGAKYIAPLEPMPTDGDPLKLQVWANKRAQQAAGAEYARNPQATTVTVPMLNATEIDEFKGRLTKGSVQDRQVTLARLASALPPEQVPLVANKIAGNDKLGDSWATAMAFYKRGQPGDRQIADSIIEGSNKWVEGGAEGREKIKLDPATFQTINAQLGTSRAGMDGRDLDMQNNAIAARYVSLMGKNDPTTPDTTVLAQAVKDVVGQAMSYHGGQHILPTGVEPYQFEDGIAGLTPADLPALRPAGGTQITADRIKRSATYQSVGDGLYKVWMPDPKAGGMHEVLRADTGRPWVIDIRPLISRGAQGSLESRFGVMPQGPQ